MDITQNWAISAPELLILTVYNAWNNLKWTNQSKSNCTELNQNLMNSKKDLMNSKCTGNFGKTTKVIWGK